MTPAYEHNGKPVSAGAFYAIACDPQRNVAVEACAGAGKTWMLVSRIVRALLDGVQPHEILAITFTKRAAAEMRERLQEWLAGFSTADAARLAEELEARGIARKQGAWPQADMPERLAGLAQGVLASGRQVQIRTFHSWFGAILRNAPLAVLQQLGLPPNYELLEDDKEARPLVWRRFYAALLAAPALRADFEAVVFDHGRFQTERALQAVLDKRLEFGLADAAGVVDVSVQHFSKQFPEFEGFELPGDWLFLRPENGQTLREAALALGRASAPGFSAKGVELEQVLGLPGPGGVVLDNTSLNLESVLGILLTKEHTARKFSEKIVGIERVRAAQALALRVVQAQRQHAAWAYQQRMARLSRLLIDSFAALKRDHGWVDMNDVERGASRMLSDPVLAGWVQQRLDARVRQVLIDEFQDTSPLQWQALSAWLSGYAGSGAGRAPGIFIVGDPKQSIYRFRRAEPQVFKAAKAFVLHGLGGDFLSCDHTRRNAPPIIEAVNAVMQVAMSGAIEGDVYEGYRNHTTASSEAGELLCLPPISRSAGAPVGDQSHSAWRNSLTEPQTEAEETLRVREARQAAQWIAARIAGGVNPKDIMVLSRRRASLAPLHEALRGLQIPSQIGEKTDLIDCCEVQDIVALLDVLVSPQHDLSLARVLKSPLFDVGDDALVRLALLRREVDHCWFDVLQKEQPLAPDGRDPAAVLLQWQRWVADLPPHDALQAIYTNGDVLARYAAAAPPALRPAVLANLRALPGVALQEGGGRFSTPYALVRALKAGGVKAVAAVVDGAVRLLTIHGAKGLEAGLVFLLDSDANPPRAESMGVLVDWPGEAAGPQKFVFLASESQPPACAADLLARDLQERQREELNALYVALTRARNVLALSSVEPHRAAPGSWWTRLAAWVKPVEPSVWLGVAAQAPEALSQTLSIQVLPQGDFRRDLAPAEAAAASQVGAAGNSVSGSVAGFTVDSDNELDVDSDASRIGQAMHRLLEWGAQEPSAEAANALAAAREFGLSAQQSARAAAMARCILQGEGAWAWNPALLAWQGNEVELVYQGQSCRLDRLVQRRDTGAWWVLDFKSATNPLADPALAAQLQQYRAAIQSLYPQAQVAAAFLTGDGKMLQLP